MCLGQGLDGKGWRSYKKEVMNKEGKEEPRKRGMIESEKRAGEMTNKVEKEKPSEKISKARFARFWDFFRGFFLFHFIGHLSLPFFRFDLPSLPWFFLSLFSFHPFLPSLPWSFLSLSIVHPFLPSLPWFFLSLFILQAFLLWSPALAVQALPLAHNVEWCLRASTASPSLHPQSGAQVGFLKMSAEGVGSRVIRAKNFG